MFDLEVGFMLLAVGVLTGVKIFAFVSSLMFPAQAYTVADKLTKPAWSIILGLGLALQILMVGAGPINFINLAFTIAALVFLADVRPALAGLRRR